MANFQKDEYKFPDEIETTMSRSEDEEEEFSVEIEDDTPPEDRGKKPLPVDIVNSLETPDEGGEYSDEVVTKFKQYKKAWHDERREKESARREQEEALRIAQSILEENQRLKSTLMTGEQAYMTTVQEAAENEITMAEREYRDAYDTGDSERLVQAQKTLTEATLKLDRAKNYQPTLQNSENEVKLPQRSQPDNTNQEPDPKFTDWQRRNSNWFNKDEEMTEEEQQMVDDAIQNFALNFIKYVREVDSSLYSRAKQYAADYSGNAVVEFIDDDKGETNENGD